MHDLNPPQAEAVEHKDGPLLVFAGAGSGKTRVITYRAARLIETHGVDPSRILLVTFTNKAANEIKTRLAALVGEHKTKRLWAGTFHAICARILRASAADIDRRPDFVVYDDGDQETVVKQIFTELGLDKKTYSPARMLARIQEAKQKAYGIDDFPVVDQDIQVFVDVWERYDAWLRACNALDFEDLILCTMRLAEGSRKMGGVLRDRFDYILVDEFQDTNFTQYRLVKALALKTGNLCVVGDDDQCHPPDTRVLRACSPNGKTTLWDPIRTLRDGDTVIGWNASGERHERTVRVRHRPWKGELVLVDAMLPTLGMRTQVRATPDHRFICRWTASLGAPDEATFDVRAENLEADTMAVPLWERGGCTVWSPILRVTRDPYEGDVYSLDVEEDHAYIANRIAVHNCIYTWRGADPRNIREFNKEYPDAKIVRLEQNYRSTKRIVACAAGVIAQSSLRTPKTLWTANPLGAPVEILDMVSDRHEAEVVCSRIKALLQKGHPARDAVILYRTHAQSRAIEDQLRDRNVPYRIVGGHRFYDRKEIKDVMAYLRLLINHDSDVDLLRVINVPARGIGPTTVKRVSEIASTRSSRLWDALPLAELAAEIGRKERLQIATFRGIVEDFTKDIGTDRPSKLAEKLIAAIGYRTMWEREAKRLSSEGKRADAEDALGRVENLDELINAIAAYEARQRAEGERPSLRDYVQMVSLLAEESKDEHADRVLLMTVHAAKGLEFPFVFLVGCEEGRFPGYRANLNPMELEEERRLAYVAITRAREGLIITHARMRFVRGNAESCTPSRFLFDMPADAVERKMGGEKAPLVDKGGWI